MNTEISKAQIYLKQIEELRQQELELKQNNDYIPSEYDSEKVGKEIEKLTKKIEELNEKILKIRELSSVDESTEVIGNHSTISGLDEIISQVESLILIRDNFEKFRFLNAEKEEILMKVSCSLTSARDNCYEEIFNDSLSDSKSIDEFINGKCLASNKLKVPFMVALLTHDPSEIYEEIINSTDILNEEQKNIVRQYIEGQKRRIEQSLVLSDSALINLLETNTGKNILRQENINSRTANNKDSYRRLANYLCSQIPTFSSGRLTTILTTHTAEEVINIFNNMASNGLLNDYANLSSQERDILKSHIEQTKNNLPQEIRMEEHKRSIAISQNGKGKIYDVVRGYNDKYSLTGDVIKRFSSGSDFIRTIDDMQVSSFPEGNIENFIGESFSSPKVSRDVKKQMIAVVLDNLQLCYDMFKSYYMSGNGNISSYITLSNDMSNQILLNQPLNNDNIQHLLGIPPTHRKDANGNVISLNLPPKTLEFLGLSADFDKSVPARVVLEKILENRDRIVNDCICGCYRGEDGILYELLPWEKIILKTNAFIRGDFFKTTSLIATINPDSYMISPDERINAVAINGTFFGNSPVYQQMPNITTGERRSPLLTGEYLVGGRNSLYQRNKDMILKGLITSLRQESDGMRISRINGVVTNESFIGERVKTSNGPALRTMNKPAYLLKGLNPESGGLVVDVVNQNGMRSTKTLDENVLLLEDLVLTFDNIQPVIDLSYEIIEQLKNVYGYSNGRKK